MGHAHSRRCALWISPELLVRADELAVLLDVDVSTLIESVVLVLHNEEALHGPMRSRAAGADKSAKGTGIPMCASSGNRRSRLIGPRVAPVPPPNDGPSRSRRGSGRTELLLTRRVGWSFNPTSTTPVGVP